jgi:hypothetical protein
VRALNNILLDFKKYCIVKMPAICRCFTEAKAAKVTAEISAILITESQLKSWVENTMSSN